MEALIRAMLSRRRRAADVAAGIQSRCFVEEGKLESPVAAFRRHLLMPAL
ncbi:hypothetical protein [Rhizobium sp. SRDI969]|jgi:hypothetical protein|nr:hypothetical protein [Rhizobium leguminosarum]UWM84897.1 hypothetical protein N2A41_29315 [Rhizobium leguminosarum bv. viciae]